MVDFGSHASSSVVAKQVTAIGGGTAVQQWLWPGLAQHESVSKQNKRKKTLCFNSEIEKRRWQLSIEN